MKALAGLVSGGVHLPVLDEDGTEALERRSLWVRGGRHRAEEEHGEVVTEAGKSRGGAHGVLKKKQRGWVSSAGSREEQEEVWKLGSVEVLKQRIQGRDSI